MKNEQNKPMYYNGCGTIQSPQKTSNSKDIIIKPIGVNIPHIPIPYFPY